MGTQAGGAPVEPLPVPVSQAETALVPPKEPAQEPVALLPDEASTAKPDQERPTEDKAAKGPVPGVDSSPTNGKPASVVVNAASITELAEPAAALSNQAPPPASPALPALSVSPPAPGQATAAAGAEAAPATAPPTESPPLAQAVQDKQGELEALFEQLTGPPAPETKEGWTGKALEAAIRAAEDDLEALRSAARARMGSRESAYDLELRSKVTAFR